MIDASSYSASSTHPSQPPLQAHSQQKQYRCSSARPRQRVEDVTSTPDRSSACRSLPSSLVSALHHSVPSVRGISPWNNSPDRCLVGADSLHHAPRQFFFDAESRGVAEQLLQIVPVPLATSRSRRALRLLLSLDRRVCVHFGGRRDAGTSSAPVDPRRTSRHSRARRWRRAHRSSRPTRSPCDQRVRAHGPSKQR